MLTNNFINEWLECGTIMSDGDGKLLLGWGPRVWHEVPTESSHRIQFYFPDYFLECKASWFEHVHQATVSAEELIELLLPYKGKTAQSQWVNSYQDLFKSTFEELRSKFSAGELIKAVPFVYEEAAGTMNPNTLGASLSSLVNYASVNAVYPYGFWDTQGGMLGATPEMLFRYTDGNTLRTMACAGTGRVDGSCGALLEDPKELHEHKLVIEGIVESLNPYGKVDVEAVKLLILPQLAHLVTPICVTLDAAPKFDELVRALHPTPAVGAFPRAPGLEWLKSYQKKINRRRFGAPVGYYMPGSKQASMFVSIRNVQWDDHRMYIAAGCGIVPESLYEKEWGEINLKLQAIKEMLLL